MGRLRRGWPRFGGLPIKHTTEPRACEVERPDPAARERLRKLEHAGEVSPARGKVVVGEAERGDGGAARKGLCEHSCHAGAQRGHLVEVELHRLVAKQHVHLAGGVASEAKVYESSLRQRGCKRVRCPLLEAVSRQVQAGEAGRRKRGGNRPAQGVAARVLWPEDALEAERLEGGAVSHCLHEGGNGVGGRRQLRLCIAAS
mmetsp:Transcript_15128/g.48647  ORF Transcript_15128/g.48647 Transcript_15128/m.48647 type:complete len:201 (-) Transcript_15128:2034-2636(-)